MNDGDTVYSVCAYGETDKPAHSVGSDRIRQVRVAVGDKICTQTDLIGWPARPMRSKDFGFSCKKGRARTQKYTPGTGKQSHIHEQSDKGKGGVSLDFTGSCKVQLWQKQYNYDY